MVDTNGYNEIQAAAVKTKKLMREGTWHEVSGWIGWVEQGVIRKLTDNIYFYNILGKVEPLYSRSSRYISSKSQGIS